MPVTGPRTYRIRLRLPATAEVVAFRTGARTDGVQHWHPYLHARDRVHEDGEMTFTFDLDRRHCTECHDRMTTRRLHDQTKGLLDRNGRMTAVRGKIPGVVRLV